jgi:hypothetical protein
VRRKKPQNRRAKFAFALAAHAVTKYPPRGSEIRRPSSCLLDFRFVHEHDRDIISHGIHPATPWAFQTFRIRPIFKHLSAGRTDQHLQLLLRKHVHYFTLEASIVSLVLCEYNFTLQSKGLAWGYRVRPAN